MEESGSAATLSANERLTRGSVWTPWSRRSYFLLTRRHAEPGARANAATWPLGVVHLCRGRVAQLTRSMKANTPYLILLAIMLTGCVSEGFRVTKKASENYHFSGRLLSGENNQAIQNVKIEIFSWYQPAFSMLSRRKLGDVITDERGEFTFWTNELELTIVVEGCMAFNSYGADPFNPREFQVFILRQKTSGFDGTQVKFIEQVGASDR